MLFRSRYRGAASFRRHRGKRAKLFVRQKRFDFEKLSYRFPAQFSQVRPSVLLNSHNFNTKTVNLSTVFVNFYHARRDFFTKTKSPPFQNGGRGLQSSFIGHGKNIFTKRTDRKIAVRKTDIPLVICHEFVFFIGRRKVKLGSVRRFVF